MRSIYIDISDCKPGMVTAESVHNQYGGIIVAQNTPLNPYIINRLESLGIQRVRVFAERSISEKERKSELFEARYQNNVNEIKNILHGVSKGENLEFEKIKRLLESFTDGGVEKRDIIRCVNQVRSVHEYTYYHCINVSMISKLIGEWIKLGKAEQNLLAQAGMLHDIGKVKIPLSILNKPDALNDDELLIMKTHPILSYRLIENIPHINEDVKKAVLMHHERCDGSGYPVGLKREKIPLFAKILSIADIFDAMTSKRPYKKMSSPFTVFQMFEDYSFGILDSAILSSFLSNITSYYIGEKVLLSNNETGEIIYINPMRFSQPVLKMEDKYVDLSVNTDLKIIEIL